MKHFRNAVENDVKTLTDKQYVFLSGKIIPYGMCAQYSFIFFVDIYIGKNYRHIQGI